MAIFDMHAPDWVLRMPKVFRSSIDSLAESEAEAERPGKRHDPYLGRAVWMSGCLIWFGWSSRVPSAQVDGQPNTIPGAGAEN